MPPEDFPMQDRVPALAKGNNGRGTARKADESDVMATSLAIAGETTLDASKFSKVWTESFDTTFGVVSRLWGDVRISNGEAILTSTKATNWAPAGMMVPPTGASAGNGYGLYTIRAETDDDEGPGPFACLWPATDVWPGPELDIFEKASSANNSGYSAIHWADANGENRYEVFYFPTNINLNDPHDYAMDWAADHISLYIDNVMVYSTNANVPKDFAHGGQNSAFGAGMQPAWAAMDQNADGTNVLHVHEMTYAAPVATATPLPRISVSDASVAEGGLLSFTVSLSTPSAGPVTVNYATENATAVASDYTGKNGTLSFDKGQTSRVVQVQTTQDTTVEPNETLVLRLSAPSGATLADAAGTGTITNDDVAGRAINGSSSNNTLRGGEGDDTITGGRGNDTMWGGGGADDFVFSRNDGFDRIKDFATGVDDLVFKGIAASQVVARAATYSGINGVDVNYGGTNHVFLEGVAMASFSVAVDVILA